MEIVGNEVFRQAVWNSFVFTAIALTCKAVLGVWLALLLARNLKGKRLLRGAVLLPWVIPTALSTLGWGWMFDSLYSVVNWTAIRLGLISAPGPNWLGMSTYAMAAVITVNVWRGLPFFAITVLAGLVSIPREYYEAAEVDGASIVRPLLARDAAPAQAGAGGGHPLLHHLHLQRLQHRLRADAGRAGEHARTCSPRSPTRSGCRAATWGRERPSRCSCCRCWGWWSSSSSGTSGESDDDHRGSQPGRAPALDRVRLRQPGSVRVLRAVSLLLHAHHLVQIQRRALQPEVGPAVDPERRDHRPLPLPVRPDRVPHLDHE